MSDRARQCAHLAALMGGELCRAASGWVLTHGRDGREEYLHSLDEVALALSRLHQDRERSGMPSASPTLLDRLESVQPKIYS